MAPKQPVLGSQAIETPLPQFVRVTENTCFQLSMFKDLMREYRRLDDTVTMRLNRNNAQFRDKDRIRGQSGPSSDEACAFFWKELIANWKGRSDIINYCVKVTDDSLNKKRKEFEGQEPGLDADRKARASLFADEVKRNQIHDELTVESIVRRRSLDAFRSRCKYFEPPLSDVEARAWWDAAMAGR